MNKHPPDRIILELYTALKDRRLVTSRHDFMARFVPGRVWANFYQHSASTVMLTNLWTTLNDAGQHDLAQKAYGALMAKLLAKVAVAGTPSQHQQIKGDQ